MIGIRLFTIQGVRLLNHPLLKEFDWFNGFQNRVNSSELLDRILHLSRKNEEYVWRVRFIDNVFDICDFTIWDGSAINSYVEDIAMMVADFKLKIHKKRWIKRINDGRVVV